MFSKKKRGLEVNATANINTLFGSFLIFFFVFFSPLKCHYCTRLLFYGETLMVKYLTQFHSSSRCSPVSCFEKFERLAPPYSKILLFDEIARPLAALVISRGFLAPVSINLAIRSPSFLCRAIRLNPGSSPIGYSAERLNIANEPSRVLAKKSITKCSFSICSKYELHRKSFIV